MVSEGGVVELQDHCVLRTEVYQKLTSKILGSTSLFHEDCIARQKMQIITHYNSDYTFSILSQACKNQTRSIILSIQIYHEVTLLLSNTHAKKMSRIKGEIPQGSVSQVQFRFHRLKFI